MKTLFHAEKGRAGTPRIVRALRKQGLVAKAGRKFKATTNSKHNLPVAPNLLEQNFYQYCSHSYQRLLKKHALVCSMSKKGDCYDNAAMESWNHSLKVESIHGQRFETRGEAMAEVFEYINIYYNRQRLHSFLGYLSPEEFEAQKVA